MTRQYLSETAAAFHILHGICDARGEMEGF